MINYKRVFDITQLIHKQRWSKLIVSWEKKENP